MTTPSKPWHRRVWVWVVLTLVVLGVAFRVALDPVASAVARKNLKQLEGYDANFDKLHVSLHSLSTTILGFKVTDAGGSKGSAASPAVLYAQRVEAHLLWRNVVKLIPEGEAEVDHGKATMLFDPNPPKTEAQKQRDKEKEEEKKKEKEERKKLGLPESPPIKLPDLYAMLEDLIPFRINRVELKDCEAVAIDTRDADHPRIWLHHVEATLENVGSRLHLQKGQSATVTLRAILQHTGQLLAFITADPLQHAPTFAGQVELRGLQLSDFYDLIKDQSHLGVHGEVNLFTSFKAEHGKVHGAAKAEVKHLRVEPTEPNLGNQLEAKAGQIAANLISDRVPGRDAAVAVVPIEGRLDDPDVQLWPAVLSVLRNAFVSGISSGYANLPPPESQKKEGVLAQAGHALSKDQGPPKAQPADGKKEEKKP